MSFKSSMKDLFDDDVIVQVPMTTDRVVQVTFKNSANVSEAITMEFNEVGLTKLLSILNAAQIAIHH